jgi:hypothetical protein
MSALRLIMAPRTPRVQEREQHRYPVANPVWSPTDWLQCVCDAASENQASAVICSVQSRNLILRDSHAMSRNPVGSALSFALFRRKPPVTCRSRLAPRLENPRDPHRR